MNRRVNPLYGAPSPFHSHPSRQWLIVFLVNSVLFCKISSRRQSLPTTKYPTAVFTTSCSTKAAITGKEFVSFGTKWASCLVLRRPPLPTKASVIAFRMLAAPSNHHRCRINGFFVTAASNSTPQTNINPTLEMSAPPINGGSRTSRRSPTCAWITSLKETSSPPRSVRLFAKDLKGSS